MFEACGGGHDLYVIIMHDFIIGNLMHSVKYSDQQQHTDGLACFSLYFMQVAIYSYNLATNFIFNCGFLFTT